MHIAFYLILCLRFSFLINVIIFLYFTITTQFISDNEIIRIIYAKLWVNAQFPMKKDILF